MEIKEILVMHHSHLDVGYTHSQPIVWNLQYEFIEQVLELLDKTRDWDEFSKPRWTVEVTAQVMSWLEKADEKSITKFQKYVNENRIGFSGMQYNTTPNSNSEQLTIQLRDAAKLNKQFGADIKTVHQHDVNGIPWGAADIMLDAGIELFVMATNNHFGGYTYKRPAAFKWVTPSDRELLVMNGAHYTMFDQLLDTPSENLSKMKDGFDEYLKHLEKIEYNLEFIYLTTANAPVCYDNAPPNFEVAKLIKGWNEQEIGPRIRYITPNMLLEKIKSTSMDKFDSVRGDWTDFWNFGSASTAYETRINQSSKSLLYTAEMISTLDLKGNRYRNIGTLDKARFDINTYDEHTWGAFNSVEYDNDFVRAQDNMKKQPAYEGKELSEYYLINELENLAENPDTNYEQEGVLVVNSSPVEKIVNVPIPEWWKESGKKLRTARFGWPNRHRQMIEADLYGPINIKPYSWKKIPLAILAKAENDALVKYGKRSDKSFVQRLNRAEGETEERGFSFIESPFHKMEFDERTGRIISLIDKKLNWEVLDQKSQYTFFQYVNESPDPMFDGDRTAMYARDLDKEKYDANCWITEWKEKRVTAVEFIESKIEHSPNGITLVLKFNVNGAKALEQRITFQGNSSNILLEFSIYKEEVRTPESIYFVFPLNLDKGWNACYDSAGINIKLDEDQLPRSSKGWQTVESYASIYNEKRGVALFCPDAPMVQMGDFNFGRKYQAISRDENPKLLAWPINNYWDTNFASAQPGLIKLKYSFSTFEKMNLNDLYNQGRNSATQLEVHPAMMCDGEQGGSFINIDDESLQLLYMKISEDKSGIIVRVIKTESNNYNSRIEFPKEIESAFIVNTHEEIVSELSTNPYSIELDLEINKITQLLVRLKN